ncbi:MAG: hypothetical protein CL607_20605 [Anaerolineaceae bacterium]|nr:hypothetical protein [Anaerolineaceae bacterium]
MSLKPPPPNLLRIALQDTIGAFAGVIAVGMLITAVPLFLLSSTENRDTGFWVMMAAVAGIFLLCLVVLIWRLPRRRRYIHEKWQRSLLRRATVVAIKVEGAGREQRRYLHFEYEYQGKTYTNIEYINRFWKIEEGASVDILIDPEDPGRALLLEVFQ